MFNKREYIMGIFEEAVPGVLKGEKAFDDAENFWLDLYLMKPTVFQKMLTIQEEEILQVTQRIEQKKRNRNL
jgi:hypothetical protein